MAKNERSDILGKIESRWSLWTAISGTGVVTGTASYFTNWLNEWGPIAWVLFALIGAAIATLIYGGIVIFYARWVMARETVRAVKRLVQTPLT